MVLTILLGLLGLGIVIFIHESGHFLFAKMLGIEVESFALGWGPRLIGIQHGTTEYRINVFPIGGYCSMKGEQEFKEAIDRKLEHFPFAEGSLFSVSPFKRILTYFAGPLFNFLFAILLFAAVWSIGYDYYTYSNKVILGSDHPEVFGSSETLSPAEEAGLRTGDRILTIDGEDIHYFSDIQQALIDHPGSEVSLTLDRDGQMITTSITPELDPDTGAGVIGITAWIEPVIRSIPDDSLLLATELRPADRITTMNGEPISHALDIYGKLNTLGGQHEYTITVVRDGTDREISLPLEFSEDGRPVFNAVFDILQVHTEDYTLAGALMKGVTETASTFSLAFHSISLMFKGLNVRESLSGPVKITYLVGTAASESFRAGFLKGVTTVFQLLAFISVALGFANLLPIPALDGGQIMVSLTEIILRREFSPQYYYRLQIIGFSILFTIMFLTLFNDISFFMR